MASPTYFSRFPEIDYSWKMNKSGIVENIKIKDYFHLLVPRDDIFRSETLYEEVVVENGMRPDQLAHQIYGDSQFYWIILQINEITDFYNQWPLSQLELDRFIVKKYGSIEKSNDVHHYETRDVFDNDGNLVLPRGMIVPGNFNFRYPADPETFSEKFANLASGGVVKITNRQYEYDLNFEKARIEVVQQRYISRYIREVRHYAARLKATGSRLAINSSIDIGETR